MKNKLNSIIGTNILFLLIILTISLSASNTNYTNANLSDIQLQEIRQVFEKKKVLENQLHEFSVKLSKRFSTEYRESTYNESIEEVQNTRQELLEIKIELSNMKTVLKNERWYNWKVFKKQLTKILERLDRKLK